MQWIGGKGGRGVMGMVLATGATGDSRMEAVLSKVAGLLINYNTPETLITGGGSAMVPLTRCFPGRGNNF